MIIGISIKNFKAIRSIKNLYLDRFHVLVGPNASGKSTFMDSFEFVKDCLIGGPWDAVVKRGVLDFKDLTFMRKGGKIVIDLWLDLKELEDDYNIQKNCILHYHLSITDDINLGVRIDEEILKRYSKTNLPSGKKIEFSEKAPYTRLLGKTSKGSDFFKREKGKYQDSFSFGLDKCALALVPPDWERYPTANIVKLLFQGGIKYIQINSRLMRYPCPATSRAFLELDGTNLAKVVGQLANEQITPHIAQKDSKKITGKEILRQWIDHLRYALKDLEDITWHRRIPDNAEYIVLKYKNGLECPSWLLSDGTLRMLLMTLLSFLPPSSGIYMVEEPENGVHPRALEIIMQSLSRIPAAQALVATHSPMVVQQVGKDRLICFSRDEEGGVNIQSGKNHPALKEWDGTPDLAAFFAMGVLE